MREAASSTLFTRDAAGYDDLRRRLIPCFDEFYGAAIRLIHEWRTQASLSVLDLGGGTGLFSGMVLEAFPVQKLRLLDGSAGMLEQARMRLKTDTEMEFHQADMAEAVLDGSWDLVISALAIHHLSDDDKRGIFSRVHAALKPGGLFVNAEQVAGPSPEADARYNRIWLEQIRQLGVPETEIEKAQERMSHDRCAPVGSQLAWLKDAGFSDVDCSFKSWRFAVISGRA